MNEKKSILDGIPVENKAFPLRENSDRKSPGPPMQIVGHCPECGNPIYGYVRLGSGEEAKVERSCSCFEGNKFDKTVHYK